MHDKILVIGSLNMDLVINVHKMPTRGETILGKKLEYIPGGKGANQAYTIGQFGGNLKMLGSIGNDSFGKKLKNNLSKANVNCNHLNLTKHTPTGTAVIYVDAAGDNNIVVISGANEKCDINYLKEKDYLIQESKYLLLQMEIPYDALFYAISRGKELGKTIILNPAPAPDNLPDYILEKIDYLTPNETELKKLTNIPNTSLENIKSGCKKLLNKGVKNIIVTLGEKGCLLSNSEAESLYPAFPAKPIDTTAAGDCFNGVLVTSLAEGKTIEKSIEFANKASSIVVTRKGAQISIPNRIEVEKVK